MTTRRPPRPAGQRPKISRSKVKRIIELSKTGCSREGIASAVGVGSSTLRRWIRRGREQKRGLYRDLVDGLVKAEGELEATLIGRINKAGRKEWTASAWLAERKWPARWGRGKDRQLAIALEEGDDGVSPLELAAALERAGVRRPLIDAMLEDMAAQVEGEEGSS